MTPPKVKTPGIEGKKDVQKLQRAIIDGLEDVKAQDIQVFDTEHITSLFERVIVASGASNRQTKALAASVRDAVRDAGFAKPRIEGEDNGEWIIVDCGAAVAHIMQPAIRVYYNLEELWGDKPIKLKLGMPAPLAKAAAAETKANAKPAKPRVAAGKTKSSAADKPQPVARKKARTDDGTYVGRVGKANDWTAQRNAVAPVAVQPEAKPARARKAAPPAKPAASQATPDIGGLTPIKKVPRKASMVKIPTKKVAARKTAVRPANKKPLAKKAATKKTTTRSE